MTKAELEKRMEKAIEILEKADETAAADAENMGARDIILISSYKMASYMATIKIALNTLKGE